MRTLTALVLLLTAACSGGGGGDSCDVPNGTYLVTGGDPLFTSAAFVVTDGLATFVCDGEGMVGSAPANACNGVITCTLVDPVGPDTVVVGNLAMDEVSDAAPFGTAQLCVDDLCAEPAPVMRGM